MLDQSWIKLIETKEDIIIEKAEKAFEMTMDCPNIKLDYTVVLEQDGTIRIDEGQPNQESEDIHFGESLGIISFKYNPNWEDDWRDKLGNEIVANETEEERENHMQNYIQWYEAEDFIQEKVNNVIERMKDRVKAMEDFTQI